MTRESEMLREWTQERERERDPALVISREAEHVPQRCSLFSLSAFCLII